MVALEQVYHSPVSQHGGSKPENVNKNSEKLDSNEIPTTTPMIPGSGSTCRLLGIRFITESRQENKCITARIHDINEIPMAIPMFPGSGNTERLLGILSYG